MICLLSFAHFLCFAVTTTTARRLKSNLNININAQQAILKASNVTCLDIRASFYINLNCFDMYAFKITCWALIFIFRLRFPLGVSIATILMRLKSIVVGMFMKL